MRRTLICLAMLATIGALSGGAQAQQWSWRFDKDGDLKGFTPVNFERAEVSGGAFRGVTKYDCMLMSPPVNIDASVYTILEFRASSTVTAGGEFFFARAGEGMAEDRQANHMLLASAEPLVYRVDLSKLPTWKGIITQFRLDLLNPAGVKLTLDYVRFYDQDWGKAKNPGFEDDFAQRGRPDAWTVRAAGSAWSSRHVAQGDRSMMVRTGAGEAAEAVLQTRVPLDELGVFSLDALLTHTEGAAPKQVAASLTYIDVFGKPLAGKPTVLGAGKPGAKGFVHVGGEFEAPGLAAGADLRLIVRGPGVSAWWDGVKVRHVREDVPACQRPLESWRGQWIWAAATLNQENVPAYLRKTFTLDAPLAQVSEARAEVTADDGYQLFVNGRKASEGDNWRAPQVIDLKPYLVEGRNVIAVQARNGASSSGVLFESAITSPQGTVDILSDGSWKGVGQAPEGWAAASFDDSQWPAAAVIGPAGSAPWGDLPYVYLGVREKITLLKADFPREVVAGEAIRVSAVVSQLPAAAESYELRCSLARGAEEIMCKTVGVAEGTAKVPGGVRLGPVDMTLSRFAPPGRYEVILGFPRTEYAPGKGVSLGAITVKAPAKSEAPPKVEVRRHCGQPTLFINGRPNSFMHYLETGVSPVRIGNMARAGIHLYELDAVDIGWKAQDKYDYTAWDARLLSLLAVDPGAYIIPTFDVSGLSHMWWVTAHPDQFARTESGSPDVGIYGSTGHIVSLASETWRQVSGDAMRRFIQHCQAAPYGSRIIGYHPCSGVSWEWQHWGSVGPFDPSDYSEPMQQAFRAWAKREYAGNVDALRAAWRQPEVSFDTIKIPSVALRDGADHLVFRDPRTYRYVIDFYKFYQDVMVDGIEHYFRIIKDVTGGKALTGTYYGYTVTMLSGARRAGDSGHYALERLLNSKLCDFLMSPIDYSARNVGESNAPMSAIGSVLAHDKLWVLQLDLRTHLVTDPMQRGYGAPADLSGTVSQERRSFANTTAKGAASQWMDFSLGWIARDPRQGQIISQLRAVGEQWVNWPNRGPDPEGFAVIVDEQTPACYMGHKWEVNLWLAYWQKLAFERVGAPWNIYLLDDVTSGRLPKFKCYFFLNCFHMTDAQRKYIVRELQGGDRTLVWMYAPGYASDTGLDVANVSQLTGMDFREAMESRMWRTTYNWEHPLLAGVRGTVFDQPGFELGPVFSPDSKTVDVAGTWEGTDLPALATRRGDHWTSVWSAGPILSPRLLKNICNRAEVHLFVDGTEPSYVTRDSIALHSAVTRTEHLRFQKPTTVTDLLTGEVLGRGVHDLDVKVAGPDTRLLRVVPAK